MGDRKEADALPGTSNGDPSGVKLQSLEIETALVPLQSELSELRRQVNDQGRQNSKDMIVFEGTAIKLQEGETERALLQRVVKTFWGLELKGFNDSNAVDEIKQVHLRKGGQEKEKWRLTAKFLNLCKDSSFFKILHTPPNLSQSGASGLTLYRHLHTVTPNDNSLSFIARQMRKAKEINRFIFDSSSGRLKVTFPDGNRQTFSEKDDLLARCSPSLYNKLSHLDKVWKRHSPSPRPRSSRKRT